MKLFEKKIYSVDQLLKDKPVQLDELEFDNEEEGNSYIDVNNVTVFANKYEIRYNNGFIVLRFYNNSKLVASVSASGSSEHKKDEVFVVDGNYIYSETSHRCMKYIFENKNN